MGLVLTLSRLFVTLLVAASTAACGTGSREPSLQYTPAQQRMLARFGPIGYELRVDAMKGEEFTGVNFYVVGLPRPFYGSGVQTLQNGSRLAMNGPVPEQVRIVWRDSGEHGREYKDGTTYSGNIVRDEVIDVGSRIPLEVIDDLKRHPRGNLRLKFRMSNQGTLLGWDIERRPGYDPSRVDPRTGFPYHVPPAYYLSGGDFKEARVIYVGTKLVKEPGWYIDRKTGNRIETDF